MMINVILHQQRQTNETRQ